MSFGNLPFPKLNFILLVDDSVVDNMINKSILRKENFSEGIESVVSALEGIRFLNHMYATSGRAPDIIFLDVKMPIVDGFGFLKLFHKQREEIKSHTKIIMLTASTDVIDYHRALADPAVFNYLKKPLNPEELRAVFTLLHLSR